MTEGNGEVRELPTGWEWAKLRDLGTLINGDRGKNYPSKNAFVEVGIPFINAGHLQGGVIQFSEMNYITEEHFNLLGGGKVQPNDILYCLRGSLGKTAIVKDKTKGAIASSLVIIRPTQNIETEYLFLFLSSPFGRDEIDKFDNGSAQPNLSAKSLGDYSVPLPPLSEQKRILEKIEELFSDLDQGIESLKTAQKQLKVYRQAVLKWAFEGKLTEEWRKQHSSTLKTGEALLAQIKAERENRYQQQLAEWETAVKEWEAIGKVGKKPTKPQQLKNFLSFTESDVSNLPQLPNSWLYVEIELFLAFDKKAMITGPFGTMLKKSDYKDAGIPVLGIENIGNGIFLSRNKIFVSEEKAEELDSFRVTGGDIIISRSGTVGEICCIPERISLALISTNLMRLSLDQRVVNSKFFVYLFQGGGTVKEQVKELCKGSTRDFLNQNILKSIKFPLPSLEEQEQIVEEIESRLSVCDQLETTIIENLQKADALRQSILKQAFEGKLVPQDLNDEPAEKLLERIKAEKSKQQQQKTIDKQLSLEGV